MSLCRSDNELSDDDLPDCEMDRHSCILSSWEASLGTSAATGQCIVTIPVTLHTTREIIARLTL
jgi:hypothetical protein